ncbi:MAG: hypothetical protein ACI8WT_000180 [Clostridium sp.]|jgi:hypothetical protein
MRELFKGILKGIKNSLKRFPQTIVISTACVVLLIYISEITPGVSGDFIETLGRVTMVIALGVPLSLCVNLFFERSEAYNKVSVYTSYLIGAVLLTLYFHFFLMDIKMVSMSRYMGLSLILYLVFLFISYLPNRDDFEFYVIKVFTRFFTTALYSLVLYLGLSAILFTIDKLLVINIKSELYYYTWLIVAGIFAPSFFLAGLKAKNETLSLNDCPRLLNVLVLYIIMPLISIYTIILYIYFAKIIITRQWPEGLVSNLVLWYSALSSCVLFFITPLLKQKTWPKRYMNYFPKVILPLIAMMFISIGIRIRAYGVTENRYFVVALGIWVFVVMIYFASAKKLRNIILPISLAAITFISVFEPFSSYSVSKYSQNKRLNNIFVKNNMISDNKVIKASTEITGEDARQISSILNYFDSNHSLKDVEKLPQDFRISGLESILGVKYTGDTNEYFSFNSSNVLRTIDIKGYDYLFNSVDNGPRNSNTGFSIDFDYELSTLNITQDANNIYKKDLQAFANKLIDKYGVNQNQQNISSEEMLFVDENDKVKIKIQFSNLSGSMYNSNGKTGSNNFQFYVLVKVK